MHKLGLQKGSNILPSFNGLNINEMGLMKDGDVIVDVEGVPHILTQFGKYLLKLPNLLKPCTGSL